MGEKSVRSHQCGVVQELQVLGQKSMCPHFMDAVGLNACLECFQRDASLFALCKAIE